MVVKSDTENRVGTISEKEKYTFLISGSADKNNEWAIEIVPEDQTREKTSIKYVVGENGEVLNLDRLQVKITDDDRPNVLIVENIDGTLVVEPTESIFIGSGSVTREPVIGEFTSLHNSIELAQKLNDKYWTYLNSDKLPTLTVSGSLSVGEDDVYIVNIPSNKFSDSNGNNISSVSVNITNSHNLDVETYLNNNGGRFVKNPQR